MLPFQWQDIRRVPNSLWLLLAPLLLLSVLVGIVSFTTSITQLSGGILALLAFAFPGLIIVSITAFWRTRVLNRNPIFRYAQAQDLHYQLEMSAKHPLAQATRQALPPHSKSKGFDLLSDTQTHYFQWNIKKNIPDSLAPVSACFVFSSDITDRSALSAATAAQYFPQLPAPLFVAADTQNIYWFCAPLESEQVIQTFEILQAL